MTPTPAMNNPAVLQLWKQFIEFFFSFPCIGCGQYTDSGIWNMLCSGCRAKIKFIPPRDCCPGCGAQIDGVLCLCSKCLRNASQLWNRAYAVFQLESYAQRIVQRFKYRNRPEIARVMGIFAAAVIRENEAAGSYDLIIPVPLHWTRWLHRGFNQSSLTAQVLARELDVPFCRSLIRVKATQQQAALNRRQRLKNLKNAFTLKKARKLKNKNILLLDDVMTTGATLTAATRVLLDNGAKRVDVMVLGRR